MNYSFWTIYRTQTGTTTLYQSEPRSNGNEGVLHILEISWTGTLQSDAVLFHTRDILWEDVSAVAELNSSCWHGGYQGFDLTEMFCRRLRFKEQ